MIKKSMNTKNIGTMGTIAIEIDSEFMTIEPMFS